MPSPNLTVASGTTRRRKPLTTPPTTPTKPATTKPTLLAPGGIKTVRPNSKLRKPTPVTAIAGQQLRSASPARSLRPPPAPGIAPTGRGNARPVRQPRASSAQPAPLPLRKSPLAQMRDEYDELKRKNNENVKKIARQEEELRRLKAQLQHKTKLGAPSAAATTITKKSKNGDNGGSTQAEMLRAKETLIQERDEELRKLRQQLEEQLRLQTSDADEPVDEKKDRETPLLEKLRMENEITSKQLAEMAKELEKLRLRQSAEKGDDDDNNNSQQLVQLHKQQLEAQQLAHEENLKQYKAALAEKDRLLLERRKALDTLKATHDEEMRHARSEHIQKNHEKEMLGKSETTKGITEDNAKLVESELQRILEEFEQSEHTHLARTENLDQTNWSARFLPTDAMSWPAPPPLSILKKTTGPKKTTAIERISSAANGDYAPILTPLNPKAVQVYISTVSGNTQVKHRQQEIQLLLRTHRIEFELVDVASSVSAFQYMKRANNNGSSEGRPTELPQLFVGGEYRGQFEQLLKSAEDGTLDDMLRPAAERDWTPEERAALQKAEAAAAIAGPGAPVRVLPAGPVVLPTLKKTSTSSPGPVQPHRSTKDEDEDEALFRELEQEIKSGKISVTDIADL